MTDTLKTCQEGESDRWRSSL